jgi:hypothetical protein
VHCFECEVSTSVNFEQAMRGQGLIRKNELIDTEDGTTLNAGIDMVRSKRKAIAHDRHLGASYFTC